MEVGTCLLSWLGLSTRRFVGIVRSMVRYFKLYHSHYTGIDSHGSMDTHVANKRMYFIRIYPQPACRGE